MKRVSWDVQSLSKTERTEALQALIDELGKEKVARLLLLLSHDEDSLEAARQRIEDELIEMRDAGISTPFRANGFVCRYYDSSPSSLIRFGPETGVSFALETIAKMVMDSE